MVVTDRAAGGQPHPDETRRLRPVARIEHLVLFLDHAPLVGRDVAAVKAGGDQLIQIGLRQQIASQLLERELIERQIAIEGLDHPVAVGPHLAIVVEVNPVGVPVASIVEPVPGPVFTIPLRFQHPVDVPQVRFGRIVRDKRLDLLDRRRQAR